MVLAWSHTARSPAGFTGKYLPGQPAAKNTRAGRGDKRILDTEFREESLMIAHKLVEHSKTRGITPGQFATAWVLANTKISAVIAGPRTLEQMEDYYPAVDIKISAEEEALVNSLVTPGHASTPGYIDPNYPFFGRTNPAADRPEAGPTCYGVNLCQYQCTKLPFPFLSADSRLFPDSGQGVRSCQRAKGGRKHLCKCGLAPGIFVLSRQIQSASDTAKFAVTRLTGIEAPKYEDNESTLAELQERIAKTVAFLSRVDVAAFKDSEVHTVTMHLANRSHYFAEVIICCTSLCPIFTST